MIFYPEIGFRFVELVNLGVDIQTANRKAFFAQLSVQMSISLTPKTPVELRLACANSSNEIEQVFIALKETEIFSREFVPKFQAYKREFSPKHYSTVINSHPLLFAHSAADLLKFGKGETYLYYFLVGVAITSWNRNNRFCKCCEWRFRRGGNVKYCPKCSTHEIPDVGEKFSHTTALRQQQKIHAVLKNSFEFKEFMKLREFGEHYILRLALGQTDTPGERLASDMLDRTPNLAYRSAKEKLAALWNNCNPSNKARKSASTDCALIDLARQGLSRSEAAQKLQISKAAVTKACQRNRLLKIEFDKQQKC